MGTVSRQMKLSHKVASATLLCCRSSGTIETPISCGTMISAPHQIELSHTVISAILTRCEHVFTSDILLNRIAVSHRIKPSHAVVSAILVHRKHAGASKNSMMVISDE